MGLGRPEADPHRVGAPVGIERLPRVGKPAAAVMADVRRGRRGRRRGRGLGDIGHGIDLGGWSFIIVRLYSPVYIACGREIDAEATEAPRRDREHGGPALP